MSQQINCDKEPLIHSYHTDGLEGSHPLAWEDIFCQRCGTMVHAGNNECMTTWLEWESHVLCGECATPLFANNDLTLHKFIKTAVGSE